MTGDISQRALARKYSVSPSEIAKHSKAEEWIKAREKHRSNIRAKAEQKIADRQADQLARIMGIAERVGEQIEQLLEAELQDPELLLHTRQHNREIESKVNALTKLYELQARHLGIMAPRDAERLKLDRERFAYEQKRDAAADGDKDQTVEIVLSGEIDTWAE